MGKTWFTSDLHFGHSNIITYCERPFSSVDHMNTELVSRWNAVVAPEDTVWVLGDVAMGTIKQNLPLVGQLTGHKILLSGNHDRCFPQLKANPSEWEPLYREAGFVEIHHGVVDFEVGSTQVRLCHFPFRSAAKDDRYHELHPDDDGGYLVHGHVHEKWRVRGRMVNVGVDVHNFAPIEAAAVEGLLLGGQQADERFEADRLA